MNRTKKFLLIGIVTLSICFGVTGCSGGDIEPTKSSFGNKYFDLVKIYDSGGIGGEEVVYDKNTNVMYFIMCSGHWFGITPIYNSDGSVKLYEGGD